MSDRAPSAGPTLSDGEVRLRPVIEPDLSLLHRMETDLETAGRYNTAPLRSMSGLRTAFERDGLIDDGGATLVIEVVGPDGGATFGGQVNHRRFPHGVKPWSDCWELGITVASSHRGQGVGTRAQRLLVHYLFATTSLHRVQATTDVDNVAEQRILERLGFAREGVFRQAQFRDGTWHDMAIYGLLRHELPLS